MFIKPSSARREGDHRCHCLSVFERGLQASQPSHFVTDASWRMPPMRTIEGGGHVLAPLTPVIMATRLVLEWALHRGAIALYLVNRIPPAHMSPPLFQNFKVNRCRRRYPRPFRRHLHHNGGVGRIDRDRHLGGGGWLVFIGMWNGCCKGVGGVQGLIS